MVVVVPVPDVQAERATQANTVPRPQPAAVSRARRVIHAMAALAFIRPPQTPAKDDISRPEGGRNRQREKTRDRSLVSGLANNSGGENADAFTVSQTRAGGRQWRARNGEY
jgi:hypothetical protein